MKLATGKPAWLQSMHQWNAIYGKYTVLCLSTLMKTNLECLAYRHTISRIAEEARESGKHPQLPIVYDELFTQHLASMVARTDPMSRGLLKCFSGIDKDLLEIAEKKLPGVLKAVAMESVGARSAGAGLALSEGNGNLASEIAERADRR